MAKKRPARAPGRKTAAKAKPSATGRTTKAASTRKSSARAGTLKSAAPGTSRKPAAKTKPPTTARYARGTAPARATKADKIKASNQPDIAATKQALTPDGRQQPDLPKTPLSEKELQEFENMLLDKRREIAGDVNNLQTQASYGNGGNMSSMPIHMADLGTDTWEQEFNLGLIEKERMLLREIDEALDRIKNRTYGVCLATGKPIAKARLRAKPWAKYCIEYARELEKQAFRGRPESRFSR